MKHEARPDLLIFEPDPRGHATEWLQHLLRHAAAGPAPVRLLLAVPSPLAQTLSAWMNETGIGNAGLRVLSAREYALCMHPRLAVSGLARWWTMRRHLARSGAARGLFLGIDHLSLPLAAGLRFGGRRVSGILFRPSVHYAPADTPRQSRREKLRDLRKALLYRLMLRNPAVETVFSLDPYFPAYGATHYGRGDKLRALPDPAFPLSPDDKSATAQSPFPPGRVAFLLFGVLTERKGLLVLLDALKRLAPDVALRTAVLIAGKIDPGLQSAAAERRAALNREKPELWLRIDDRHHTNDELSLLTQSCDVALAPYQRFVGSSGIVIRAANAGKPVITQNYGLLHRLVRDYGLGTACETTDADALAAALAGTVRLGPDRLCDPAGVARFLAGRTPEDFAARLIGPLLSAATAARAPREARGPETPAMDWSRSRPS
ncbi:glycosyltransferase [Parvibaculum sp.]|uniref:glycosyltransferase n=1 Tax=Parvibaculum sp. TaxID=2024848 RepID=UPI0034A06C77